MKKSLWLLLSVIYPFLFFYSRDRVDPRWIAAIPLSLIALQTWPRLKRKLNKPLALTLLIAVSFLFFWKSVLSLKLYPVGVNLTLLAVFGYGLIKPPSFIQKIAALYEGPLSPRITAYTRKVTWAWCLFFLLNGTAAAYTVWLGDDKVWTLYNGLISYLLMGILGLSEWLIRKRVRAQDLALKNEAVES